VSGSYQYKNVQTAGKRYKRRQSALAKRQLLHIDCMYKAKGNQSFKTAAQPLYDAA